MRRFNFPKARTQLFRLLSDLERGETIVITRNGRAVARIVPESGQRREEITRAIADITALRRKAGHMTTREILSARDEGREWCGE